MALVLLIALVAFQPLYSLALLALLLAFLCSSITALTTEKGPRRWLLWSLSGALAVATLLVMILWGAHEEHAAWVGPIALLFAVAGFPLGRFALRLAPETTAAPTAAPTFATGPRPVRHPVLLINPKSGGGKAEKFGLVDLARELDVETVVLERDDDLLQLAEAAVARGADCLAMAGGDGSQALVLGVAAQHDLPFVCIPAGTRNHFALDLGLDRDDPRQAFHAFTQGEPRVIDYATVNGQVFVNNVTLGVYAAIVEQESYRDAKLQTTLDLLPTLAKGDGPWFDLDFDVPDHGHLSSTALLMVSNNRYQLATGLVQRQRLDAGTLGLMTLNPSSTTDIVGISLLAATGHADASKSMWVWDAPTFTVGSPHPTISAGVDGETIELQTPIEFASVAHGITVLLPPGSRIGVDEQVVGNDSRRSGLLKVAFNLVSVERESEPFRPN